MEGGLELSVFSVPFSPNHSLILWFYLGEEVWGSYLGFLVLTASVSAISFVSDTKKIFWNPCAIQLCWLLSSSFSFSVSMATQTYHILNVSSSKFWCWERTICIPNLLIPCWGEKEEKIVFYFFFFLSPFSGFVNAMDILLVFCTFTWINWFFWTLFDTVV